MGTSNSDRCRNEATRMMPTTAMTRLTPALVQPVTTPPGLICKQEDEGVTICTGANIFLGRAVLLVG